MPVRFRPLRPIWGLSSDGRATRLQREGHRFNSDSLHIHPVSSTEERLSYKEWVEGSNPSSGICLPGLKGKFRHAGAEISVRFRWWAPCLLDREARWPAATRLTQVRILQGTPFALVAQSEELLVTNQMVPGSSPGRGLLLCTAYGAARAMHASSHPVWVFFTQHTHNIRFAKADQGVMMNTRKQKLKRHGAGLLLLPEWGKVEVWQSGFVPGF